MRNLTKIRKTKIPSVDKMIQTYEFLYGTFEKKKIKR